MVACDCMARVPVDTNTIVHAYNHGVLKNEVFFSEEDKWRFVRTLRYKNHPASIKNWHNDVRSEVDGKTMPWPDDWPKEDPLVHIHGYTLMDNHYHLILQEAQEGGLARFMQKLANSYVEYIRRKYERDEQLFSGSYERKIVSSDDYLQMLFVYVLVKNPFERFSGGIESAQ